MRISDWSSDVCSSDLRYANACGAIVVSRHGCSPAMPTWEELQVFLASDERPFRLRDDAALEQLHWATTRAGSWDELMVLAMDHRSQFEALCAQRSEEHTSELQSLMRISYAVFCLKKKKKQQQRREKK